MMKPVVTEKAVMLIESQNSLTFKTDKKDGKEDIKKQVEELFDVKVQNVRTLIRGNKKYAYVKLNAKNPAIDIATKVGMI